MSRQIKFRVWDKKERVMDVPTAIGFDDSGKIDAVNADHKNLWCDEFLLEQFTGLKDENGKDIYEGDLLKVKMQDSWQIHPELVKHLWDPYVWMAESDPYYAVRKMIVIGNIHENPELLEVR